MINIYNGKRASKSVMLKLKLVLTCVELVLKLFVSTFSLESPHPAVVPVTVITQTGLPLGITYFKYIDKEYSMAMEILSGDVDLSKLLSIMTKTPGK